MNRKQAAITIAIEEALLGLLPEGVDPRTKQVALDEARARAHYATDFFDTRREIILCVRGLCSDTSDREDELLSMKTLRENHRLPLLTKQQVGDILDIEKNLPRQKKMRSEEILGENLILAAEMRKRGMIE